MPIKGRGVINQGSGLGAYLENRVVGNNGNWFYYPGMCSTSSDSQTGA